MNPWQVTSPCGPGCLPAAASTPAAPVPLRVLRYAGIAGLFAATVPLGLLLPALSRRSRSAVVRAWCRTALAVLGVRLRVTGAPPLPAAGTRRPGAGSRWVRQPGDLVVANHVSWLDVVALSAVRPLPILAKREVAGWPVVGILARLAGALYIDRERLRTLPRSVAQVTGLLRAGRSVLVFPEGTTRCGRAPGRFRPALFQAAVDARATVRPVLVGYRLTDGRPCTAPAYLGDDTLLASLRRMVATAGLVAELTLLAPLDAPTGAGRGRSAPRRELARRTEAAIVAGRQVKGSGSSGMVARCTGAPRARSCATKPG